LIWHFVAMSAIDDAPRFRFRVVPLIVTAALAFAVPYLGVFAAIYASRIFHTPSPTGPTLGWLYSQHAFQLIFALVFIVVLKRFQAFDAGLRLPPERTYVPSAILWGLFFGVLMTIVDYAPDLLARRPMDLGFPVTRDNIVGWSIFEGIYVGPTEEIPFRSLLVGYLISAMPGKIRLGRFSMSWAGIIVAVLFALLHFTSFFTRPSLAAAGQQVYAFALGVLYAYWFEKSKSIVAPIVGHNVSDLTEYAICFVLIALWR